MIISDSDRRQPPSLFWNHDTVRCKIPLHDEISQHYSAGQSSVSTSDPVYIRQPPIHSPAPQNALIARYRLTPSRGLLPTPPEPSNTQPSKRSSQFIAVGSFNIRGRGGQREHSREGQRAGPELVSILQIVVVQAEISPTVTKHEGPIARLDNIPWSSQCQ